jgi:hypothetical protein
MSDSKADSLRRRYPKDLGHVLWDVIKDLFGPDHPNRRDRRQDKVDTLNWEKISLLDLAQQR